MTKMFGAVKLEDLEKDTSSSETEAPKMGAVKMEGLKEETAETVETTESAEKTTEPIEKTEDIPKMGEQKAEPKPVETFVPKMPDEDKGQDQTEVEGLNATSFRMDMMVEADEEIGSTKGIFSGAQEAPKGVTPIRSAIFQQDDVDFKGKTATHAETVFNTDTAIKEEQQEKEKVEKIEESAEAGAKRVNKAWGTGTGNATEQAAEEAKEEVEKVKAGKIIEAEKKVEQKVEQPSKPKEEPVAEEISGGIFTAKPAKGSFINKILGNVQAIFNKPIGKPKEDKKDSK